MSMTMAMVPLTNRSSITHSCMESSASGRAAKANRLGGGDVSTGGAGWKMVIVYRGLHCPKCKAYLTRLEELKDRFAEINT